MKSMDVWNKVCRACLSTKESFTYFLFQNVTPEAYLFCTSIEVHKGEELPKAICNSCHELLRRYSEFKQTCIQSQSSLQSYSKTVAEPYVQPESPTLLEVNFTLDGQVTLNDVEKIKEAKLEFNVPLKEEVISDQYNDDLPATSTAEFSDDTIQKKVKIHKRKKLAKPKRNRAKNEVKLKKRKVQSNAASSHSTYSCEFCAKRFRNHLIYEAHKLEHEGKKMSFECAPCNKTFLTWSGARRHAASAHERVSLRRLACAACGRLCGSRQTLRAHELSAHAPRALCVCHVCGRRVASAIILRKHLETHKEDRERRHACEHCGKKFFTSTALSLHTSRQHTGRRFVCAHCGYPFTDKFNLAKHMLIHDGKKPYKCDICRKSYASKSTLVEHKRIHSGERPFACSFCPKSFVSKRRLSDHVKTHTGEKPHKCGVCEQRFTQRGTLQRHMKVHVKAVRTLH